MSAARIGKIRMKAGGAEVRLIRQETQDADGSENWRGRILSSARAMADFSEPDRELVGYFVMGMFSDGSVSTGWRYDPARSPLPRALMPAYVAEVVRQDMITEPEACDAVNRANGFPD